MAMTQQHRQQHRQQLYDYGNANDDKQHQQRDDISYDAHNKATKRHPHTKSASQSSRAREDQAHIQTSQWSWCSSRGWW